MSNFSPVPLLAFARSVANLLQMTPAQTGTVGMVKPGAAMTVAIDGTINPVFGTTTGTVADGGALASETTARITGQANNANAAAAAQASETSARETGDSANATAIATETTNREAAITSEANTRAAADTANASAISAETTRAEGVEALKAPLASPALSGTPTAPTASPLTSDTQIATTAYADAGVTVEKTRAEGAESTLTTSVGTAQSTANTALTTANAAQPAIAANAGKVLTGPNTAGGAPGTLPVNAANGLVGTDSSGNISAQTVLATGSSAARSLALSVELYPENFGAAGNGTTDDTAAINAYIAYVKSQRSASNSNSITFQLKPNSIYPVSGPLNFGYMFAHGVPGAYTPAFTILMNGATIIGTTNGPAIVDCINFGYGSSIHNGYIIGNSGGAQGCGLLFGYSQAGTSGFGWSDAFRKVNVSITGYFAYGCEINRGADTSVAYLDNNVNMTSANVGIDIGSAGFCTIIDSQGQWPIISDICALMPLTVENNVLYAKRDCVDQSQNGSPFWVNSNVSLSFDKGYANSTGGTPVPGCVIYVLETLHVGEQRIEWTTHMETTGSLSYDFYWYAPWATSTVSVAYSEFHWSDPSYEASVAAFGSSSYVSYIRLQNAYINASPQNTTTPLFDVPGHFLISGTIQNLPPAAWTPPALFNGNFFGGSPSTSYTWGTGTGLYWNQADPTGDLTVVGTSSWAVSAPMQLNAGSSITAYGPVTFSGQTFFDQNIAHVSSGYSVEGLSVGWNVSGGVGEVDFIVGSSGGSGGGLRIYQATTAGAITIASPIFNLSNLGGLTIAGGFDATALTIAGSATLGGTTVSSLTSGSFVQATFSYEATGNSPNGFLTPAGKDKIYFSAGTSSSSATIMLPVPTRLNQEISYLFRVAFTSVTFQAQYPAWAASTAYALNTIILDSNYNLQQATVAGTSGAAAPTWGTTVGGTTTDGSATWTMLANPVVGAPTSIPNTSGPTVVKFVCQTLGSATTVPVWWRD